MVICSHALSTVFFDNLQDFRKKTKCQEYNMGNSSHLFYLLFIRLEFSFSGVNDLLRTTDNKCRDNFYFGKD